MHIPPFDNENRAIVDVDNPTVPLNYFNIVKLTGGQSFTSRVPGFETCIVPATGTVDVDVEGERAPPRQDPGRGRGSRPSADAARMSGTASPKASMSPPAPAPP